MPQVTLVEAVNMALARAMENDPSVVVLGEDVGAYGGAFGVTQGLHDEFGEMRVIDTPWALISFNTSSAGRFPFASV